MIPKALLDTDLFDVLVKDSLKNCTAFVTGGSSGINLGIAHTLAALGASIAICGRDEGRLEAARKQLNTYGGEVFAKPADVRDEAALSSAINTCRETLGPISFLVCGAAGNFVAPAEKISANGFKTVLDIDLVGTFLAAKLAFEQLKETQGSALFISAGQAIAPYLGQAHVGAAKAGIEMLMQNLALEWGRSGVRVNCLIPGPIAGTKGMDVLGAGEAEALWRPAIPLGRMGQVSDVANQAAFLASPLASFVTGTSIRVDGGQNLTGSYRFNEAVQQNSVAGET